MRPARFLHLLAHRGDTAAFPENTLPAFQSALDLGVRFIEVDVQMAANGVPVALRESTLAHGDGSLAVGDLTAAEIAQFDASAPERFGERFRGTRIPRLVEVLSLLTRRPHTTVFVTIGRASLLRFGHEQVVAQLIEALKPFRAGCVLVSSDLAALHRARQAAGFPIGWEIASLDAHTRIKFEALQPEYLFCNRSALPPDVTLWRGPWRWVVRDVPTLEVALKLARCGADFVATGDVRSLSEAMRAHALATAAPARPDVPLADDETTVASGANPGAHAH